MASQTLRDLRVVVTRATDQASTLRNLLVERGAIPIELPTIRTEPARDVGELDRAIKSLDQYAWVIFTSPNGVRYVVERCEALGVDIGRLNRLQVAAIGPSTASALKAHHVRVELQPERAIAESLVASLLSCEVTGKRILLPVARGARDVVEAGLTARGAIVDRVVAYETLTVGNPAIARQIVADADVVTLTSSSTARQLAVLLGDDLSPALYAVAVASIGPVTSQTAREHGIQVQVEAVEHTIVGMVSAIEEWADAHVEEVSRWRSR